MAKTTRSQKVQRFIVFIMGLRDPKVRKAMMRRGFTEEQWHEGWVLLTELVRIAHDTPDDLFESADDAVFEQLDALENTWFPAVEATLRRHYPEVCDEVFHNLTQTSGPNLVVNLDTFVARIEGLEVPRDGADNDSRLEARNLLRERGFTDEVLDAFRTPLATFARLGPMPAPAPIDPDEHAAKVDEAEDALWKYYLEWSSIARSVIGDKTLLRRLGFLKRRESRSADVEEDEYEPTNELPVVP